jgi:hypothetical protein
VAFGQAGSTGDHSMDMELMRARNREKAREARVRNAPIKLKERALKKELGRKLTQGEKNLIRLSQVGS